MLNNKTLCAKCSGQIAENKWLPTSIYDWRKVVLSRVYKYETNDSDPRYAIFSNVAYNLQYLEYLHKCLKEQYLTSVIRSQLIKTYTLTSSQIIECLLYIKLIDMKVNQNEIWEFSQALRIAEQKNAYGLGLHFYKNELKRIKELRNKVHLQSSEGIADADYAVFENISVLNDVKKILFVFLQKCLSLPTSEMNETFYFLLPIEDFVHSRKD
jgi:hypothetical protein